MRYPVLLEPCDEGGFAVHVPALPGCHTQGETVQEALHNAKDAIRVYLRTLRQVARERKNRRSKLYQVEVAV